MPNKWYIPDEIISGKECRDQAGNISIVLESRLLQTELVDFLVESEKTQQLSEGKKFSETQALNFFSSFSLTNRMKHGFTSTLVALFKYVNVTERKKKVYVLIFNSCFLPFQIGFMFYHHKLNNIYKLLKILLLLNKYCIQENN